MDTNGALEERFSTVTPAGGLRLAQSSASSATVLTAHTDGVLRLWSLQQTDAPVKSLRCVARATQ